MEYNNLRMYTSKTIEPQVRILEILHSCFHPDLPSLFDVKVLPGRGLCDQKTHLTWIWVMIMPSGVSAEMISSPGKGPKSKIVVMVGANLFLAEAEHLQ